MTTITCKPCIVFLCIKSHLFKKNSSHTKNQLNGYNITGNINGRLVHTTRTYGPYGQKSIACNAFFRTGRTYGSYVRVLVHTTRTYGPLKWPIRTSTYGRKKTCPYVQAVRTDHPYGPYVRVVCTGLKNTWLSH